MYKQDLDVCRVIRRLQDEWGWPNEIFATAGKNKTEMIVEAARITRGAMLLSVAAQSMDPSVLEEIKRKNVSIESMRSAIEQTKKTSGVQRMTSALIVPLPGETFESAVQGMRTLVDMDMDYICTYTLLLLEGTEIASSQSRKQYGMVTKFRVVPDYYGSFRDINVVEIEEVCIGTNTISTDEYFDLRGIHFFLAGYHADHNMFEIRRYLRNFEISALDWILLMKKLIASAPEVTRDIYHKFIQASRDELWGSERDILEFWTVPENREKFICGDVGGNLIFEFRARAVTTCLRELVDFGGMAAIKMVLGRHPELREETVVREVLDIANYVYLKRKMALSDEDIAETWCHEFNHDVLAWESEGCSRPLCAYRVEAPAAIRFFYPEDRQAKLRLVLQEHGSSPKEIGLMLRRYNPLFFVRAVGYAEKGTPIAGIDRPGVASFGGDVR